MDKVNKEAIIKLYGEGYSIRKVSGLIGFSYQRESIRKVLKQENIPIRGRGVVYKHYLKFTGEESALFAEFLGYFYGDGHIHKYVDPGHGLYECLLCFSLNERDIVKRVVYITGRLFNFKPRVVKQEGRYLIKFRRSLAKYLYNFGYPVGKKSLINPRLPLDKLRNKLMKKHFICGFLNAEASINKTVCVQQSIRIKIPKDKLEALKERHQPYFMRGRRCYFIKWSDVKTFIDLSETSNVLCDLSKLLADFKIPSRIYPIRLYIGKNDTSSIHFELTMPPRYIKNIKEQGMLSCDKKLKKLASRECQSGQMSWLQEPVA